MQEGGSVSPPAAPSSSPRRDSCGSASSSVSSLTAEGGEHEETAPGYQDKSKAVGTSGKVDKRAGGPSRPRQDDGDSDRAAASAVTELQSELSRSKSKLAASGLPSKSGTIIRAPSAKRLFPSRGDASTESASDGVSGGLIEADEFGISMTPTTTTTAADKDAGSGGDHIRTACRVRPMLERELRLARSGAAPPPSAQRLLAQQVALKSSKCIEVLPPAPDLLDPTDPNAPPRPPVSTTVSVSNQTISFDYVADEAASQEEIYLELGEPLVQNCIDGYNASILCYGQTGSGKSYTMFGNSSFFAQPSGNSTNPAVPTPKATGQATPKVGGNGSNSSSNNNNPNSSSSSSADNWDPFQDRERGLVPRILEALWQPSSGSGGATSNHIILGTPSYEAGDTSPLASPSEDRARRFSLRPTPELAVTLAGLAVGGSPSEGMRRQSVSVAIARKLKCRCSFYEIYQEKVFDLLDLDTTHSSAGLAVREDTLLGVYVAGLTECEVSSQEEARAIMLRGYANRRVAETAMNRESSRSHAIFQLLLEFSECRMDGAIVTKAAKMCMVDLAGSERQRDTLATNARLKEAAAINKSLSTLGRVINSLVEAAGGKTATYIPFRDSKLTFLLRDALGGNSKTTLVATVSPSIESLGDSLSTLKFVNRAKRICTAAVSSERPVESVLELQREIAKLKAMLVHAQAAHGGRAASAELAEARELLTQERHRIADLCGQLQDALLVNAQLESQVRELGASLEQMRLEREEELGEQTEVHTDVDDVRRTNDSPSATTTATAAIDNCTTRGSGGGSGSVQQVPVVASGGCFAFLPWPFGPRKSKSKGNSITDSNSAEEFGEAAAAAASSSGSTGTSSKPPSPPKPPKKRQHGHHRHHGHHARGGGKHKG